MLEIVIESERIRIGRDAVPYDGYYFGFSEGPESSVEQVLRRVLAQWADAVELMSNTQSTVYLPFSLDDEWVEAFRARLTDHQVSLRCVRLAVNGYMVNVEDLKDFMQEPHRIEREESHDFGSYDRTDFIAALRNTRIDAA